MLKRKNSREGRKSIQDDFKTWWAVLLCWGLAAGLSPAGAEPTEEKIQQLEQRVRALEQAKKGEPVLASFGPHKLGLLLQLQGIHDATLGVHDDFRGRRAEIKLYGDLLSKRISYAAMIDPFLAGNITKDAYVLLSYIPYADIRFGQFKFPQGLEGRWPSGDLDFAERATVSSQFGDKRDFAFQIEGAKIPAGPPSASLASGGPVGFEYAVAAVNGSGQNTVDNNDHKDAGARAGFQAGPLWLGASGIWGQQPTGIRDRAGAETRLVLGPWKFQGEYLVGDTPTAAGVPTTPQQGYYALTSTRWRCLRPGVRFQVWDPDTRIKGNLQKWTTLGLDVFVAEDHFKWTFNYTLKRDEDTTTNTDEARMQFQVKF